MRICHFTSVHDWNDDRIFLKECQSLVKAGHEVYIVAEGIDCDVAGVHVIGCGEKPLGRRARMGDFARLVYEKACDLDCAVYHFHDPELLPYGMKLKEKGKIVIFDSHEDVPGQIMSKEWIPVPLRWIISRLYRMYESYAVRKFDAVVTATPYIATLFKNRAKKVVVINNYPKLDDIVFQKKPFKEREAIVCYAGGISEIRGEKIMIEAMRGIPNAKLVLAGPCEEEKGISTGNIKYLGKVSRAEVNKLYGNSRVGIVLYQPAPNHYESQPIKMFEYMAAGIPVVCSDFPLWKRIVLESRCGLCVDSTNVKEVEAACVQLLFNVERAQEMGRCGRNMVERKYSWLVEERKLLGLYNEV